MNFGKIEEITCKACKSTFRVHSLSSAEMELLTCPVCNDCKNKEVIEAMQEIVKDDKKMWKFIDLMRKFGGY